jgi:hypothetical protein
MVEAAGIYNYHSALKGQNCLEDVHNRLFWVWYETRKYTLWQDILLLK